MKLWVEIRHLVAREMAVCQECALTPHRRQGPDALSGHVRICAAALTSERPYCGHRMGQAPAFRDHPPIELCPGDAADRHQPRVVVPGALFAFNVICRRSER